jgi:hypothetical protein
VAPLTAAVETAREIQHPTLLWQAAHRLAVAQARAGADDAAAAAARLAGVTIDRVMAAAPEPALRTTFLEWRRVQEALEDVERLGGRRGA